jgi:RNA-directed DNA polymerase
MGVCVRSVAVFNNLYWKMRLVGWGIFRWPQVGYFGWPSGEIPKPEGGVRKLGIPTVLDRFVQQAVMQVLQRRWDRTFSEHSYGFRPGRSAHQAVNQAQRCIAEGYRWVVDLDLEKFFDQVNHDKLMARTAERVSDKRVLKLVRAFLCAGVMENGLVSPVDEGTPQGGPLTPPTQ